MDLPFNPRLCKLAARRRMSAVCTWLLYVSDCSLQNAKSDHGSLTVRLENAGTVYGLMSANLPYQFMGDKEETALFAEIAGDIAYALRSIETGTELRQEQTLMAEIAHNYPNSYLSIINKDLTVDFSAGQEFAKQGEFKI